MKHWGVALLLLFAVGACTAGPEPIDPAPTTRAPEPAPAACPASGVRVTLGVADAAMGLRVQELRLANCGDRPYHLDGYPLLRVLDENRERMNVRIGRGSSGIATVEGFDAPPRSLTLQPGQRASTQLLWRNTNTGVEAPQVGQYLRIAPAEGRPWQPVELSGDYRDGLQIDLGSTGELGVRAWYR